MFADAEPAASKDTAIITIMARAIITIMTMITAMPTGMPAAADTTTTTRMGMGMTTATIMGITTTATITTGITGTSTMAPVPQASPYRA
ncbi:hypothetical protein CLV74_10924 [Donghicola tyrosinivorans]|uniref:Uncharacterized protein n=1 Tax=Donghicola tyrosinivorans TaxID=1652492 RepID=A0A2T0WMF2_9RHOB|nr:hypothetical protein CLV74_10924 [Donghicola tyrosinivorans]